MAPKSSGGVTGFCFARMKQVCFCVSVATTTELSASVYLQELIVLAWWVLLDRAALACVRCSNVSLEENADGHFYNGLYARCFVSVDLV